MAQLVNRFHAVLGHTMGDENLDYTISSVGIWVIQTKKKLLLPVSRVGTGLVQIIHLQINNLQMACDIDL